MPPFLLIGIPIVVAVLLFGILTLPEDDPTEDLRDADSITPKKPLKKKK